MTPARKAAQTSAGGVRAARSRSTATPNADSGACTPTPLGAVKADPSHAGRAWRSILILSRARLRQLSAVRPSSP